MHSKPLLFCGLAALTFISACSEEAPAKKSDPAQRRERIELSAPALPETAAQEMRNSRLSVQRISADAREAWTAPCPGSVTIEAPATGAARFAGAIALVGFPKDKPVPHVRLAFDIDLDGGKTHEKSSVTAGFAEALNGWCPFEAPRGAGDDVKVVIRASFIGENIPKDIEGLRFAVACPDFAARASAEAALAQPPKEKPNVLVISVDTLRADHLGAWGYLRPTSPHIDALIQSGVRFENAYSAAPWTLPSYGSLFTSLLPADHRAGIVTEREDAWGKDETPAKRTTELMRSDVATLAGVLSKAGFQTAAFVNNPFLGSASGVGRGFEQYTSYQYNAKNGVDLALEWTDAHREAPWFLFLHLFDPHMPYAPPKPFDTSFSARGLDDLKDWSPNLQELRKARPSDEMVKQLVDFYDGEIAFVDDQIGRLLEALRSQGELDNTVIVFHSDHGEEFWEHGSCDHGHSQYDELLHVPLAFVCPGKLLAGLEISTRVRAIDVMPTLLELAGAAIPAGIAGKSLMPVIAKTETADRTSISEAILHGSREIKAILSSRWKLIASGASSNLLFESTTPHFADDKDLAATKRGDVARLRADLTSHQLAAKQAAKSSAPLKFDPAQQSRIKDLGYAGEDLEDPKDAKKKP